MKALSLTQPWGWLICSLPELWKDVENRRWNTKFRGAFLIHAAKRCTLVDYDGALAWVERHIGADVALQIPKREDLRLGGIIGQTTLVDVIRPYSLSILNKRSWHMQERYGFVLTDRKALPFTPCAGALGFWRVPSEVLSQIELAEFLA